MANLLLFAAEEIPRSPSVKRMHVVDAGNGPGCKVIQFECGHCGHDTGWIEDKCSVTENKRGMPCPECN